MFRIPPDVGPREGLWTWGRAYRIFFTSIGPRIALVARIAVYKARFSGSTLAWGKAMKAMNPDLG